MIRTRWGGFVRVEDEAHRGLQEGEGGEGAVQAQGVEGAEELLHLKGHGGGSLGGGSSSCQEDYDR